MSFNLQKQRKEALQNLPPLPDVALEDSPLNLSWMAAASKMLPVYKAQDPTVTDIFSAMARFGKSVEDVMEEAQAVTPEVLREQQDAVDTTNVIKDQLAFAKSSNSKMIKKGYKMVKPFNLKKAQNFMAAQPPMDPMGFNETPELMGDNLEMQQDGGNRKFANGADVQKWLTSEVDQKTALQYVTANDDGTGLVDMVKEAIEDFYASMSEPMMDARELEKKAGDIFDALPEILKTNEGIMAQPKTFAEITEIIKAMAEKTAERNKKKVFNLKKTAQHKTLQNTIMWGPGQTRKVDPFLRQPVSDWHIVERNKGFGLVVDDVWNIDYETIWRENIMDKYSRPYKDAEGNWVGGYIQKRFEVDKNIPETSNYQLKPGQRRKPVILEHGNTEARLQAARAAGEIEGANNTTKPFNWKEAKKKS